MLQIVGDDALFMLGLHVDNVQQHAKGGTVGLGRP